jgi:hypothetical protein
LPRNPDIDRLLEEGLSKYGAGDFDGALVAWEGVLEREPNNAQANGYVDYVRSHYDTLSTRSLSGWPPEPLPLTVELEADEPDPSHDGDLAGTTRRYPGGEPPPDFEGDEECTASFRGEDTTSSFHSDGTQAGFQTEVTSVKQRELGFVQPAADAQARPRTSDPTAPRAASSSPLSQGSAPMLEPGAADAGGTGGNKATNDPPSGARPPASVTAARTPRIDPTAVSQAELHLTTVPTRELARAPTQMPPDAELLPTQLPLEVESAVSGTQPAHDVDPTVFVAMPTQDLGLRAAARMPTNDDSPTREADVRAFRKQHGAQSIADREAAVLAEIDAGAPADESIEDQTRRRITRLVERALAWNDSGELAKAVAAAELALSEEPDSPLAQKLIHRNRDAILLVFQTFCGSLDRQPELARSLQQLNETPINPRAAFLLSRIDGTLTIDEILDVSGMPRLEAYRYLCQLFMREILK